MQTSENTTFLKGSVNRGTKKGRGYLGNPGPSRVGEVVRRLHYKTERQDQEQGDYRRHRGYEGERFESSLSSEPQQRLEHPEKVAVHL
jgi:hypothetical protein